MKPIELEQLTGKTSRTYSAGKATRAQVKRPIHVAIAVWDEPYAAAKHGQVSGWVIVCHTGAGRPSITSGQTEEPNPNELIMESLNQACAQHRVGKDDVWVVVGRRRKTLRNLLISSGFDVTGTFSDDNRAHLTAARLHKSHSKAFAKKARQQGQAPAATKNKVAEVTETHWLPNASQTRGTDTSVWISCDASSDTHSKGSTCFVVHNGDYHLHTWKTRASVDELELDGITEALRYVSKVGAQTALIETDSMAALAAVEYIQRGGRSRHRRKGINPQARTRFYHAWKRAEEHCSITIQRVTGHSGDPLNKAADSIAYMALRATQHPRKTAQPTLNRAITKALKEARRDATPLLRKKLPATAR